MDDRLYSRTSKGILVVRALLMAFMACYVLRIILLYVLRAPSHR